MSKKQYPQIGQTSKHKPRKRCKLCPSNSPASLGADMQVEVQWNIFRGDDSVYHVHQSCWGWLLQEIHETGSSDNKARFFVDRVKEIE